MERLKEGKIRMDLCGTSGKSWDMTCMELWNVYGTFGKALDRTCISGHFGCGKENWASVDRLGPTMGASIRLIVGACCSQPLLGSVVFGKEIGMLHATLFGWYCAQHDNGMLHSTLVG